MSNDSQHMYTDMQVIFSPRLHTHTHTHTYQSVSLERFNTGTTLSSNFELITYTQSKDQGQIHPSRGHEGPGGSRGTALLFLLPPHKVEVGGQCHAPATLLPGKIPGILCTGGWVGPKVGLDGCRRTRSHRDVTPRPSSP